MGLSLAMLRQARFRVVAVPTPVNDDHTPDLFPVECAGKILVQNLTKGSIVVDELVAEAAKVIENAQRDINIAFMNEPSIIFNKMGIDTKAVLTAAGTWKVPRSFAMPISHCS